MAKLKDTQIYGDLGITGLLNASGPLKTTNNIYIDNHGVGGNAQIALAVGDGDSGLHSATDGRIALYANNSEVGYWNGTEFNFTGGEIKENGANLATESYVDTNSGSDVSISDDGTQTLSATSDINFGGNLGVTDDGDGTVTVDTEQGSGSGLDADTVDGQEASAFASSGHDHDGTYINSDGDTMTGQLTVEETLDHITLYGTDSSSSWPQFLFSTSRGREASVEYDAGAQALKFKSFLDTDGTSMGTAGNDLIWMDPINHHVDAANGELREQGNRVATRTWVNNNAGSALSVSGNGTQVLAEVSDINFSNQLSVGDDGDGTVSVSISQGSEGGLDADTVDGTHGWELHREGTQATDFLLERRTSDPSSPDVGRMWYRTDLD